MDNLPGKKQVPRDLQEILHKCASDKFEVLTDAGLTWSRFSIISYGCQLWAHGYYHREGEIKELVDALEKILIKSPISDRSDSMNLYTEAKDILNKYTK